MPKPEKYKSVGISIDAYQKLIFIADQEDRALGRQLSRMIEESYEDVQERVNSKRGYQPAAVGIGGITTVIED